MTDHRASEGKALFAILALLAHGNAMAEPVEAAKIGDGIAAFALGDHVRARAIFEHLAAAGDAEATWRLGWMLESGHAGPADLAGAARLYERAAAVGHAAAAARLAELAAEGVSAESGPEALELLNRAAGAGSVRAMILLGKAYAEGEIVGFDPQAAKAWFEQALSADPDGSYSTYARNSISVLETAYGRVN